MKNKKIGKRNKTKYFLAAAFILLLIIAAMEFYIPVCVEERLDSDTDDFQDVYKKYVDAYPDMDVSHLEQQSVTEGTYYTITESSNALLHKDVMLERWFEPMDLKCNKLFDYFDLIVISKHKTEFETVDMYNTKVIRLHPQKVIMVKERSDMWSKKDEPDLEKDQYTYHLIDMNKLGQFKFWLGLAVPKLRTTP